MPVLRRLLQASSCGLSRESTGEFTGESLEFSFEFRGVSVSLDDADELPPPEELATDAISELEEAVAELNRVLALLEGNGLESKPGVRAAE